jgi:hypothetical protein
MWPSPLLPVAIALAAFWLVWRYETQRFDERSLDEPRGLDMTESEFRDRLVDQRKRRRAGISVLSGLGAAVLAMAAMSLVGLPGPTGG